MMVVMVFVLIDVITLTVVTAIPEARDAPTLIEDEQNPSTVNVCLTNFYTLSVDTVQNVLFHELKTSICAQGSIP